MTSGKQELEARAFRLFEAALEQPADERREWIREQAGDDTELCALALKILSNDKDGPDILLTGGAVTEYKIDEAPPKRIGVYKIDERIGQGGMGAVYRAHRDVGDFDHEVAIKLIKPGVINDSLKERFVREQQVLAGFSHPNIAHLYDGGTTEEGVPYIVMELIDGVSLSEWAEQNKLSLEERLELFKTVCQAVAYAHQHLIIHRDLTPSNVLVTKDGVVKLIDFGIAKPFEEGTPDQDRPGSLAGLSFTPGFAAPERSKGAAANTLSDIYSLGKLLEDILPEDQINAELQAICVRATAVQPEDRYASVNDLERDIENYMTGYPVKAYASGPGYSVRKFIARNRLPTVFAGLAITSLVLGLVITSVLYQRARVAQLAANKRFGQVRQMANTMMFDVYDEIARVPGTINGRQKLVETAQEYLDGLSVDRQATFDLRREAAEGHLRLAHILGSPKGASLFNVKEAKRQLNTAQNLLEGLLAERPEDKSVLSAMGQMYLRRAEISIDPDARLDRALEEVKKSKTYYEKALKLDPDDYQLRLQSVSPYSTEVTIRLRQNKREEAERLARENVKRTTDLLATKPESLEARRIRAGTLRGLAVVLTRRQKFEETLSPLTEAIAELNQLVKRNPHDFALSRGLMIAHWRRAFSLANLKRYEAALKDYERALRLARQAVERDPNDPDARLNLVIIQGETYLPNVNLKRYAQAAKVLDASLDYYQAQYDKDPASGRNQRAMLVQHFQMADFYHTIHDDSKRCHHLARLKKYTDIMRKAGTLGEADSREIDTYLKGTSPCPG